MSVKMEPPIFAYHVTKSRFEPWNVIIFKLCVPLCLQAPNDENRQNGGGRVTSLSLPRSIMMTGWTAYSRFEKNIGP